MACSLAKIPQDYFFSLALLLRKNIIATELFDNLTLMAYQFDRLVFKFCAKLSSGCYGSVYLPCLRKSFCSFCSFLSALQFKLLPHSPVPHNCYIASTRTCLASCSRTLVFAHFSFSAPVSTFFFPSGHFQKCFAPQGNPMFKFFLLFSCHSLLIHV